MEVKAIKEVKRVHKPVQRKLMEDNESGWFGVSAEKEPLWKHAEEVMDGLE